MTGKEDGLRKRARRRARDLFEQIWGEWKGGRELVRGLFHVSLGLIAWFLIHIMEFGLWTIFIILSVCSFTFLVLDEIRILVANWKGNGRFTRFLKWINEKWVNKLMVRESEKVVKTTIRLSIFGLLTAWVSWLLVGSWLALMAALLFSFVDPLSKLGKYWPIHPFDTGLKKGKSLGGCLFGLLGGVLGAAWLAGFHFYTPLFPSELPWWHIGLVYTAGVATAPLWELYGGKWDNFWIPAGSAAVMSLAYFLLGG